MSAPRHVLTVLRAKVRAAAVRESAAQAQLDRAGRRFTAARVHARKVGKELRAALHVAMRAGAL